jgi:hypothetical protein
VKTLGNFNAGDGALTVVQKSTPLIVGDDEVGIDVAVVFRVDGEASKKGISIGSGEPADVGDVFDAGSAQNPVFVIKGNGVEERSAVNHQNAVGHSGLGPEMEGPPDDLEKGKEKQGHGEGANGEEKAHLFAEQVGKNNARELHAAPRAFHWCRTKDLLGHSWASFLQ